MKLAFSLFLASVLSGSSQSASSPFHLDAIVESDAKANLRMPGGSSGGSAVYGMTNQKNNEVLVYTRDAATGTLTFEGAFATGGSGGSVGRLSGPPLDNELPPSQTDPLGSQDPMIVSGRCLLVVNAGSDTVSSFRINNAQSIDLAGCYPTGGTYPVSVAARDGIAYVLNAGGNGSFQGYAFSKGNCCRMRPIGKTIELSQGGGGVDPDGAAPADPPFELASPAMIGFTPDGDLLAIVKTNGGGQNLLFPGKGSLNHYAIGDDGTTSPSALTQTLVTGRSHPTSFPFAFDFDKDGNLLVVHGSIDGLDPATGAAGTGGISVWKETNGSYAQVDTVNVRQRTSCWARFNSANQCVYTSNAAAGSISSVSTEDGKYQLVESAAASLNGPLDLVFSQDNQFLYVVSPGFTDGTNQPQIYVYETASDCGLTEVQVVADGYDPSFLAVDGVAGIAIYDP